MHRIPFVQTRQNPGDPIYMSYTQMAIALDIDCLEGKAYFSDITGNCSFVFRQVCLLRIYLYLVTMTLLKLLLGTTHAHISD